MLAAEPSGYFIGPFAESFGKLFFIQALFMHECIKSVRNSEREPTFLSFLAGNLIEYFL